jgi:tetratricopeptide (TPR) repeat protein
MEKSMKVSLLNEMERLLGNYLGKSDAKNFCMRIVNQSQSHLNDNLQQVEKENAQINFEIPIGLSERELIQSIVTFAENNTSAEYLNKLLLELCHLMIFNGELELAVELAEDLISRIGVNSEFDLLKAEANLALAKIYWSQAYWEKSIEFVNESYEIFQTNQELSGFAKCENMLGSIYGEKGDVIKAQEHFLKGLGYLEEIDDPSLRSMLEINIGVIYGMQGENAKALWNFKNVLQTCIHLNDLRKVSRVRHNLGMIYTKVKDYHAALEEFNESINLSIENGYLSNCAIGYIGKAFIYTKLNNIALAEAFTDKALEIAYKINDALSIADVYKIKGMIQNNLGNFELSEEMFENSIRLNEDFENKFNNAESKAELGDLYQKENKVNEAKILRDSAIGYYDLIKAKSHIDDLLEANSN